MLAYILTFSAFFFYGDIDTTEFNMLIKQEYALHQDWVEDPLLITEKFIKHSANIYYTEVKMAKVLYNGRWGWKVELYNTYTEDDSVAGELLEFYLVKAYQDNYFTVSDASFKCRCWEGRGHQEYTTEICN